MPPRVANPLDITLDNVHTKHMNDLPISQKNLLLIAGIAGLLVGLLISLFLFSGKPEAMMVRAYEIPTEPTPTPKPEQAPMKTAKVTAYSCGGLTTPEQIRMNCPSLKKYPKGRTSSGTTPRPYITVACARANMGKKFYLEGIGEVVCEDTGGAIKGSGRFDLYVTNVQEARKFGVQTIKYREVK